MGDVSALYDLVAGGFSARVDLIGAEQWSSPTSHPDWTVRDMVAHVISTQLRVLAILDGPEAGTVHPDDDLAGQWHRASAAMITTLNDRERASKTIRGLLGTQAFETLVGQLICPDTLVHTWELSLAIGQDPSLDPAAMAACTAILTPVDDAVRRPGGFAAKIATPPGADEQTKFLHFCGQPTSVSVSK